MSLVYICSLSKDMSEREMRIEFLGVGWASNHDIEIRNQFGFCVPTLEPPGTAVIHGELTVLASRAYIHTRVHTCTYPYTSD